jgi:pimeloyl-ACP methyl ester carboxylesterase/DNA-binding CsgD family transcriptional regulator
MKQDVRFCTSADGTRIAFATSGRGSPLVMSSTWLTHLEHQHRSLAWQPWLEALSRDHTLLRYDARGCGMSDRHPADLSFESWIADIEAVVEAAGFDRFALLGTCWGGPIAITYAARHAERVDNLVLYGTYSRGRFKRIDSPHEIEKARVLLDLTQLGWGRENHAFAQVWASAFQPGGTIEHLRSWCDLQRVSTSAETAVALQRVSWEIDVRATAALVSCPTLVVHAERDAVVPLEEGRILASMIAGAHFLQIDSDNHMLLPQEPAWLRFLSEVRGFLGQRDHALDRSAAQLQAAGLTPREADVVEGVAQGLGNVEIAQRLGLSEKTVRNLVTRIFDKLNVQTRSHAIVLAREAGFGQQGSGTA